MINLVGALTLAACVLLAVALGYLSPFFREEWTLWAVLAVMVGGLILVARRRRRS